MIVFQQDGQSMRKVIDLESGTLLEIAHIDVLYTWSEVITTTDWVIRYLMKPVKDRFISDDRKFIDQLLYEKASVVGGYINFWNGVRIIKSGSMIQMVNDALQFRYTFDISQVSLDKKTATVKVSIPDPKKTEIEYYYIDLVSWRPTSPTEEMVFEEI